jgi:uncharacterized protein YihD (DUF1040 family)
MNDVLDENEKKQRHLHDALAAVRFLENLHAEIKYAKSLEDIQDELILQKFSEVVCFISEEFKKLG